MPFTERTFSFLRGLKRHNNRAWFQARRAAYESEVRAPMVEFIERLAADLPQFAPDLIASPRVSLYRIYRDTRFSADKSPYKTHVAAIFPCRGLPKHEGAGLYLEVSPERLLAAGGLYAPQTEQLHRVRSHLASHFTQFRAIVESPAFRRKFGRVDGETLRRVPLGFPRDHPAGAYLKLRQFLAGHEYPSRFATSPRFYSSLVNVFRELAPFVRFLNEPLITRATELEAGPFLWP